MDKVWTFIKKEPAVITTMVTAVLALLVGVGLNLSGEAVGAITAFAAVLAGVITRYAVTPAFVDTEFQKERVEEEVAKLERV